MVETLYAVDSVLFVTVNQSLANPVTDALMPLITNDNFLRVGYALVVALVLWRGDSRLRWAALASAVVIALADQLSSAALKPLFERARPCHDGALESVRLLVNCGAGKSFPSSHAANAFAVCVYYPVALAGKPWARQLRYGLLALAAVVSLSRVFVGVHYPADILAGAALGALCGVSAGLIFATLWRRVTTSRVRTEHP